MRCVKCGKLTLEQTDLCQKCENIFYKWYKEIIFLCEKNSKSSLFVEKMKNLWLQRL